MTACAACASKPSKSSCAAQQSRKPAYATCSVTHGLHQPCHYTGHDEDKKQSQTRVAPGQGTREAIGGKTTKPPVAARRSGHELSAPNRCGRLRGVHGARSGHLGCPSPVVAGHPVVPVRRPKKTIGSKPWFWFRRRIDTISCQPTNWTNQTHQLLQRGATPKTSFPSMSHELRSPGPRTHTDRTTAGYVLHLRWLGAKRRGCRERAAHRAVQTPRRSVRSWVGPSKPRDEAQPVRPLRIRAQLGSRTCVDPIERLGGNTPPRTRSKFRIGRTGRRPVHCLDAELARWSRSKARAAWFWVQ